LNERASPEQARAELDGYYQAYLSDIGMKGNKRATAIALDPAARGLAGLRRQFSKPLLIVMTIVGLVLLIGCANVANLLLARASARRREIALRLAIGASRSRLVRQLFTEGLLLSTLAAGVGVLFARWGVAALVALFAGIRGRIVLEPQLDGDVMAFTAAVALATSLLFSIAPALYTTRADAAKPGGFAGAGVGGFRFRAGNLLVVIQIMLSAALLCVAALFLRSLHNLTHLDAGFQRESILTMQVDATLPKSAAKGSAAAEEETARIGRMWEDLLAPVRELSQVRAASASFLIPLNGRRLGLRMHVGGEPPRPEGEGVSMNAVSAGYFDAFGVALLAGRMFTLNDRGDSPRVAILNQAAARKAFADSNPLGRRVLFPGQVVSAEYEIVGVVGDTRNVDLRQQPGPMVYLPIEQALGPVSGVAIAIRGKDPAGLLSMVRRRIREIVPGGFITNVATVQQLVDESLLEERLLALLASLFGVLASLLAAIGLYGIVSFTVIRRTREIGVRIAMGAQRSGVVWLILRDTIGLTGIGIVLGLPLVFAAKKYIESELFGLKGEDPIAIASATILLASIALAAGIWPAWRAGRVDPMVSLRQE
jgi:predicted permease